ncbi:MarR family transcriptional regulator [Terriglobus albidus]|uniref:MarR family transcriptional regulator n=1 Tax=Terriglobus albidus TaxID=1592106 RepID=A0A5B9EA40_9BACT|nr:MarR family transcriptional regulator [Terriglobus albidus]QEE26976.1 MarR family transcriptional regulator [Terriglobus albidus]
MAKDSQRTSRETAQELHSAAIHLLRRLRNEDDSSGLSAPRLSALSVIVFGGPVCLRDLARAEKVKPPTMTRIVHALEAQGLVRKQQNANDGRGISLSATTAGKKLLLESRNRRVQPLTRQIDALTAQQRELLAEAARLLTTIVRDQVR